MMNTRFSRPFLMILLLLLTALPLAAQEAEIKNVAEALSQALSKTPNTTVAVIDFTDLQGCVNPLGKYVAQELETALANTGGNFALIDRTRLQFIMQEHKLDVSGPIDPSTAKKLGLIAGVQVLVTGTLTPMTDTVRLTVKAMDTESARIVAAVPRNLLLTHDIDPLIKANTCAGGPLPPQPTPDPAPPQPVPHSPHPAPSLSMEAQQIDFELKSCSLSGNSAICDVLVTNHADDRNIEIFAGWVNNGRTRIFDDQGRETLVSEAKLGSHTQVGGNGVSSLLISGVPTRLQLVFEKVSSDISSITKIEIGCNVEGKESSIWFKKVPLSSRR